MLAPLHVAPLAYLFLLAVCLLSMISFLRPDFSARFRLYPYAISRGRRLHGLFTSVFFHTGWIHLIANLFFAVIYLPEVEYMLVDDFGRFYGEMLFFCMVFGIALFSGLVAAYKHRAEIGYSSLGLSAAVFGNCEFYYFYFPVEVNDDGGIITGALHGYQMGLFGFIALSLFVWLKVGKAAPIHFFGAVGGLILAICVRPDLVKEIAHVFG